jgi:DNA-binding GntR family transcriptional regulator
MSPSASQADLAYSLIKRAVVDGKFAPGEILTETQLADFCRVSRTPVREAVHRLEMEQVLVRGERGISIPDPTSEEIYELYETRAILECAVSRLAAERRTEIDLANIDRWLTTQQTMPTDDFADVIAVNLELARAVWRASHNRSLWEMLERIGLPHSRFGGQSTLSMPGQLEKMIESHVALRNAIADRDGALAEEVSLKRTIAARDARIEMWQLRKRPATQDGALVHG